MIIEVAKTSIMQEQEQPPEVELPQEQIRQELLPQVQTPELHIQIITQDLKLPMVQDRVLM